MISLFQSTRIPRGGATFSPASRAVGSIFQSTHPTRGCDSAVVFELPVASISIHAPHEGVRRKGGCVNGTILYFNPRTPRGGATRSLFPLHSFLNFNPRTPRGGATDVSEHHQPVIFISIHAPHEGVRRAGNPTCRNVSRFQSMHPTRGCDLDAKGVDKTSKISIHAPHEGVRLFVGRSVSAGISDISIHAPHEGVRRFPMTNRDRLIISIHAPHEGVRQANAWREQNAWQFQSTHPTRGCDGRGRP